MPLTLSRRRSAAVLAALMTLGACVPGESQTLTGGQLPPEPAARPIQAQAQVPAPATFEQWRARFRTRALAAGITPTTFEKAFQGVSPNTQVLELDTRQPEFTRAIWEYLDSAVSQSRIATGSSNAASKSAVLSEIEARFGVDSEYVVAIWGIESGFGSNFGSIPVVESMATLAYDSRRSAFGEEQLLAALRILQAGDITPQRMVGSWAGAMGHTQFIPTSFLDYAVDFTGDGRRDLWAADAQDALASTANYLARFGWRQGAPVVVEVTLPQGFDYLVADDRTEKTAADWTALGVRARQGQLPAAEAVRILLPAGAGGPAFATYPNFRVIKRYNNATSYALAVTYLGERIAGRPGIQGSWPTGDRPLSRSEKQELQGRLTALGFDTQGVDGIIGPNSRSAVRQFQLARGLVPDGYVSAGLLQAVRAAGG
ncbi:MAG: lytic murein transglycosylase [Pseudomonadota bacterium]